MKITILSSKAVRPAAAAASPEVMPLSVFDKANFDTYVFVVYAFRPPTPPNAALEAGLARALAAYREWAGRTRTPAPAPSSSPTRACSSSRPPPTPRSTPPCSYARPPR